MAAVPIKSETDRRTRKAVVRVAAGDPEYVLSIVGLTLVLSGQAIIGLVVSAVALHDSKREGRYNLFAFLGLVFGIIFSALTVIVVALYIFVVFGSGFLRHGVYY